MKLFDTPANEFEPNPMVIKWGRLEGMKCKTCSLLHKFDYRCKVYYKCEYRGISHSAATDHRVKWNACKLYGGNIPKF